MLENINNIGQYVRESSEDTSILDMMINQINNDSIEYVLEIDVSEKGITTRVKDFYKEVVKDALFYQAGRGFLGGGVRLDFYKESKVKGACDFCEISDKYEEVKQLIESYLNEEKNNKGFVLIKLNGKTPREVLENKFLNRMYESVYKKMDGGFKCHLCGAEGEGYNTAIYKFYTNDKEIYGDFVICKDCISNILIGRDYIEDNLSSFWLGSKVMFLPHEYDEDMACIYESSYLNEKQEISKFLLKLSKNEELVFEMLGNSKYDTLTDIIFYDKEGEKTFYIYHEVQGVLPSKFSEVAKYLSEYKLKVYSILEYIAAVKMSIDKVETTDKEKMRMIDAIFKGKKIDRNLFFKRAMDVYKLHYMNDKHQYTMLIINRVYNFLCRCKCLEKGWNVMKDYKGYAELFSDNIEYFDSNEKKAWFILGKCYDYMIYKLKDKPVLNSESEEVQKTPLEKNFFFARKFNFEDFIYFCNLLEDKAIKYMITNTTYKNMLSEAKLYMANRENKLSQDEAKYLFFWGLHSYFKPDSEEKKGGNNNG